MSERLQTLSSILLIISSLLLLANSCYQLGYKKGIKDAMIRTDCVCIEKEKAK